MRENTNLQSVCEMMNRVINVCFGRDRLKDEVKQLLILPIVVFFVLSAYILRLSNHIRFRLLRSRLLFSIRRPIGPVHRHRRRSRSIPQWYTYMCFIQFKNQQGVKFKIIHVDASIITLISSINCMLAYKTVLQAHRASTAFMDFVQRAAIAVV